MKNVRLSLALLGVAFVIGLTSGVRADAPALIPVQGFLSDAKGAPVKGTHRVTFSIFNAKTGGKVQHTDDFQTLDITNGAFVAYLGTQTDLDLGLFQSHGELWLEVVVDGTEIISPRMQLGSVPYAAYAQSCGAADSASEATHAVSADSASEATHAVSADTASAAGGALASRIADIETAASALPARVGVVAVSVERTGNVPPGTSGWTTIPGLTATFTLTQTSLVQLTGNGTQRTLNTGAGTNCQVGYRYLIDNTAKGDPSWGQRIQASYNSASWHSTWSIVDFSTLGPGQHTIELQAINPVSGGCYICAELDGSLNTHDSCTLNVVAIPN